MEPWGTPELVDQNWELWPFKDTNYENHDFFLCQKIL